MPGAYKRKSERERGKAGRWTIWWTGEDGRRQYGTGLTDKAESLKIAQRRESEARMVREGIVERGERLRRESALRSIVDHVGDYHLDLLAKGDGARHAKHIASTLRRILEDASAGTVNDLAPDRIRGALGRLKVNRSARTCNHALGAVKAFARWLKDAGRIKEIPSGLLGLTPYNEESDRKRVRRALTPDELARLLAAAEQGAPLLVSYGKTKSKLHGQMITGPERAALYRLAMGTGFRADELRTLTPERFSLEGDSPTVTVLACYSKNGKTAVQPITRELATQLRPFVEGKPAGVPFLIVPTRTAQLLRHDLAAAGIPEVDAIGRVLDFHALRHSYITHLINSGVNPKIVQTLARHSTITLTLDRYTHVEDADLRRAIEGDEDSAPH